MKRDELSRPLRKPSLFPTLDMVCHMSTFRLEDDGTISLVDDNSGGGSSQSQPRKTPASKDVSQVGLPAPTPSPSKS